MLSCPTFRLPDEGSRVQLPKRRNFIPSRRWTTKGQLNTMQRTIARNIQTSIKIVFLISKGNEHFTRILHYSSPEAIFFRITCIEGMIS